MRTKITFLAAAMAVGLVGFDAAQAQDLDTVWKEGVRMQSSDGAVKIKLSGRVHNDWTVWMGDNKDIEAALGEELETGTEFRRARLGIAGTLYDQFEFKAEYDFAGGDADFKDVYLGLLDTPLGGFRVGHYKEPLSLEVLTSSNHITFLERALPVSAFAPERNTGFMLHDTGMESRLVWALGLFRESDDFGNEEGEDHAWNYTGRLALAPVYEDQGAQVIHTGVGVSFKNPDDNTIQFRARPEVGQAPRFVDTGDISADRAFIVNAEAAAVMDSFSLQGEYFYTSIDSSDGLSDDPSFPGYYVMASYFLTGDRRNYELGKGTFGRVVPNCPFLGGQGGIGAWELAARYSYLDLNDSGVQGGELQDVTVGLNWYLHANVRWMLNYVYADLKDIDEAHALTTRFQVDF